MPRTVPLPRPLAGRDLGSAALAAAAVLALLALARPVSTTTSTDVQGPATATSGWFGSLSTVDGDGTRTVAVGAVPSFGWAVLVGLALVVVAAAVRWRTGRAAAIGVAAAGWWVTTGALVGLHTAARADRVRDVLADVVPGQVVLTGSAGPWLLVAAGVLAALSAAAAPRPRRARVAREPAAPVVEWNPVTGSDR